MAEEFENLELRDENTGEVETFTPVDVTAREQIESLNETLTESNIFGKGTRVQAGEDLNDYMTPGNYYCFSSSDAVTIENSPVTNSGYRLFIFDITGNSDRLMQICLANSFSTPLRFRNYFNTGWGEWATISTT